jgi:hypothetical protein
MSRHAITSRAAVATTLAAAIAIIAACGGKGGGQQSAANCPAIDGPEFATAIDSYLDGLDPVPLRFLYYTTGDSALPEGARTELEAKGPTYLFPADPALQAKQLAALKAKGAFTTLLVLYLGTQPKGARTTLRFAGRYTDSAGIDNATPVKSVTFECRDRSWQQATAATTPSA